MRHAWGAAIDLNYNENCECNTSSGSLSVTCGSGWWPLGMDSSSYAGSLTGPSPYSISPTGSVVKAFALRLGLGRELDGYPAGTSCTLASYPAAG